MAAVLIFLLLCTVVLFVYIWYILENKIVSSIPWVGDQKNNRYSRLILYLQSVLSSPVFLEQGYQKFSRHGKPFVFANIFTGPEVLLPPEYMDWIHDQPENVISSFEAHREFMRADWTFLHPTIFHEHVFQSVIKKQLTRQLDDLTDTLAEEAIVAIDSLANSSADAGFELKTHSQWKRLVLQTVSRIYVGLPLCRDDSYLDSAATFNDMSMLVAALISMVPPLLRPLLAPIICLRDYVYHLRCAAKTKPIIAKRLDSISRLGSRDAPDDLITWAVEDALTASSAQPFKKSLDFLAARISMMNFVSIDSTSITIENVLYDILSHPYERSEKDSQSQASGATLLDDLRFEAQTAFKKHQDQPSQWKLIIKNLPILDACLKESFRLNNFISRTNIRKVVTENGIDIPGIGWIPPGVKLGVSLWGAHHDGDVYQNPSDWCMSRWLDCPEKARASIFGKGGGDCSYQYLPFGYRRHACPGRFFAIRVVKLIIVHMMLNYDMELLGKEKRWNPWLGVSRGPPMGGSIRFRKRV